MAEQIPLVDYLVLDDGEPHLVAQECTNCGARFFDRRNACAGCFATEFKAVPVATEGTVRAFTIVTFAAPGIPVPFVASVVDCDGTQVRTNLVNVEPDPETCPRRDEGTTRNVPDRHRLQRDRGRRLRLRTRGLTKPHTPRRSSE